MRAEVRLTDAVGDLLGGLDGIQNVPLNFLTDVVNIPYYLFNAPYGVDGLVPQFAADGQTVLEGFDYPGLPGALVTSDPVDATGTSTGALNNLANALLYTGSWWQSSATNVWGWDTANPWNFSALLNTLIPIQPLSEPLGQNLNTIMAAEFPIAESANKFFFNDLLGELQTLFRVPLSDLAGGSGWTFPDPSTNPVGVGAGPLGFNPDGVTYPEIWSGVKPHLDPTLGLGFGETQDWGGSTNFLQSLTEPWSPDKIHLPDLQNAVPTLWNLYNSFNTDFSPFYLGADPQTGELIPGTDTMLIQGAKYLYGVPNIINGIFNGDNGGIFGPNFPNVIPTQLTEALGGPLNWLIGPNSEIANGVVGINNLFMAMVNEIELATGGNGVPGFVGDNAPTISTILADLAPTNLFEGFDPANMLSGLDIPNLFSGLDLSNLFTGLDLSNILTAFDFSSLLPDLATMLGPDFAANMAGAIDPMTFLSLLF
ncbi:hypothetical protein B8W67_15315 [Mycolicibacillus koreensis]|uniref:PE-PPE domain-containing protein n=1 Tax=Mycolicibacillus koreensis TaxID=1069220 RepID=A0AA91SQP3_9MYCO|nr:hypothetical protein B8W67_15315 [Mycolicibacillus koreensis]